MNTAPQRYTGPAIAAHWIIALLIIAAWPLGVYMHELPLSPEKLKLYAYHKWIGITVLLLFVPRILWRITHRPPTKATSASSTRPTCFPATRKNAAISSTSTTRTPPAARAWMRGWNRNWNRCWMPRRSKKRPRLGTEFHNPP